MKRDLYDAFTLDTLNIEGSRYYLLPKSRVLVPSVTTVIYAGKKFEETPYTVKARNRGTKVHDLCDQWLNNGEIETKGAMPANIETFHKFEKAYKKHLSEINLIEGTLWSKHLLTAGTLDLLGVWDGELALIDNKTSKYPKKRERIENYFIQAAAYAQMVTSRYRLQVKKLIILISNDEESECQIFEESFHKYFRALEEVFVTQRDDRNANNGKRRKE